LDRILEKSGFEEGRLVRVLEAPVIRGQIRSGVLKIEFDVLRELRPLAARELV